MLLGFGFLDALYQTVTTVTTVGFREVQPLDPAGQVFTIALILVGVGTALYALGAVLEGFIEGDLRTHLGRRRMDRAISRTSGHVIVCGWGRVRQLQQAVPAGHRPDDRRRGSRPRPVGGRRRAARAR